MVESVISNEVSSEPAAGRLKRGTVGAPTIIAMVIAAAAPITCTVTLIPLAILLGNGIGTPGAILVVTLVLALFSLGFVRVLPFIKNTGAFYAYITAGLGRPAGLVSGYTLKLAYIALGASIVSGFGYYGSNLLSDYVHLDVPWWVCAIVGVALGTLLTTLGVAVQGRVLLVILAMELIALTVLDVSILLQNGIDSYSFDAFSPKDIFSGSIGVAGIYAFTLFLGFEATAIYSEEARNPERTVPKATYWVIGIIGVFHTLSTWSLTAGAGGASVQSSVAENPPLFTFGLFNQYVGHGWTSVVLLINMLSLFAGILAFQNAAARYGFALARDKVFPRIFGITHSRYGTPVGSLFIVGAVYVALTIAYSAAGLDPVLQMSTSLVGIGALGLLVMLTLASASIGLFFLRRREVTFPKVWAPLIAALLLACCAYGGFANYSAITGVSTWWINHLYLVYVPLIMAGAAYVLWVRKYQPEKYSQIGQTRL